MKYLFVHQNFPGLYLHILRHLAAPGKHEILFITEENENAIPGVRKLVYAIKREPSPGTHGNAREFEQAMIRAETVAVAAAGLQRLGFVPDIIIGHHGWGEMLNLRDVWPDAPMLGYFEFYYHVTGLDVDFDPARRPPASSIPRIRTGPARRSRYCRKAPTWTRAEPIPRCAASH